MTSKSIKKITDEELKAFVAKRQARLDKDREKRNSPEGRAKAKELRDRKRAEEQALLAEAAKRGIIKKDEE